MKYKTALGALAIAAAVVAGCGSSNNNGGGGGGSKSGSIALLLPESKTARYESQDRPDFTNKVKQLCPDCSVVYSNADQDASKQQQQAEAALTKGVKVMVLDPVDAASAAAIVTRANQQKVPVISYDRLISNSDLAYYISFDNVQVGQLQATSLVGQLKKSGKSSGSVVMINGAPTDNNAKLFKQGAHSVLDKSGFKVAKEFDTPDWSPDKAQSEMEQSITALGKNGFVGVYAANDGTAGGAIAAMKGQGVSPKSRPTTGQDAELAGIQRIVSGDQYMTVYKQFPPEAAKAAQLAVAVLRGENAPAGLVNTSTDNGKEKVPSVILKPLAVVKSNVNDTIVKDGFWKASQICTTKYKSACQAAGISGS